MTGMMPGFCALIGAATLGACSNNEVPLAQARADEPQELMTALCEARDEAGRDPSAAEKIFFDRAHGPLHDLANDTAELDREAAARLVEAKQAEEADFDGASSIGALRSDLDALIDSTVRTLEATSGAAPDCSQGSDNG